MRSKCLITNLIISAMLIILNFNVYADSDLPQQYLNYQPIVNQINGTIPVKIPVGTTYFRAVNKFGKTLMFKGVNKQGKIVDPEYCAVCTTGLTNKYGRFCKKLRNDNDLKTKVLMRTIGTKYANLPFCPLITNNTSNFQLANNRNNVSFLVDSKIIECYFYSESGGDIIASWPKDCNTITVNTQTQ